MLAVYQSLLRLYPSLYREQFAEEMISVFRDIDAETRKKGITAAQSSTFARSAACFAELSPNTPGAFSAATFRSHSHLGGSPCVPVSVSPNPLHF